MRYYSGKVYTHAEGLSCVFRQWRAKSHCRFLHGYSLQVELAFTADELDENGWVLDFGSLRYVRDFLHNTFDHKLLMASDDPARALFEKLDAAQLVELMIMPHVGCEAFARFIFDHVLALTPSRAKLVSVTVREHEGNWAKVSGRNDDLGIE